jgi:hypothetical protein
LQAQAAIIYTHPYKVISKSEARVPIVAILIVLLLIFWAVHYWYITIVALGVVWGIRLAYQQHGARLRRIQKENEARQKQVAEERRRIEEQKRLAAQAEHAKRKKEEMHRAAQMALKTELTDLCTNSVAALDRIPHRIVGAERSIDLAEVDYSDRAFAPFWDDIEAAAEELGEFGSEIRQLKANSDRYREISRNYQNTPPGFPVSNFSLAKLDSATATAQRLQNVVRRAQRDIDFAQIYEARRTNAILIKGFANLAQALREMTCRIESSIQDLARSVSDLGTDLEGVVASIQASVDETQKSTTRAATESASRQRRTIGLLEEIQDRLEHP